RRAPVLVVIDVLAATDDARMPEASVEVGVPATVVVAEALDHVDLGAAVPLVSAGPDREPEIRRRDHAHAGLPDHVLTQARPALRQLPDRLEGAAAHIVAL